jgi:hypothetical protein
MRSYHGRRGGKNFGVAREGGAEDGGVRGMQWLRKWVVAAVEVDRESGLPGGKALEGKAETRKRRF